MAKKEDIMHSVLIVSSSEKFDSVARRSLQGFMSVDSRKTAVSARRSILERYYDLVVINAPLQDESGEQFAVDTVLSCNASVLLVIASEFYEAVKDHVTDQGILVVAKPLPRGELDKAVRFLIAVQNRIHLLEKKIQTAEEKLEENRLVSKAKILLVEKKHMSEDEAHRYLGKQAMDHGISRRRMAENMIEDLSDQ